MADHSKILAFVAGCNDASKLKTLIKNAKKGGQHDVEEAAFKKLISLVPSEERGTVAHELWQTILAFEHILSEERGKTTLLARTRQKLSRVSAEQTLADWALGDSETKGFAMLLERNLPELTGEAIVLRHAEEFDPSVVDAARSRLVEAGVDVGRLPKQI